MRRPRYSQQRRASVNEPVGDAARRFSRSPLPSTKAPKPAYYDGQLFTVNMTELPDSFRVAIRRRDIDEIYATNDWTRTDFIPVIVPSSDVHPLWTILIVSSAICASSVRLRRQSGAAADPTLIMLVTDEVYRGGKSDPISAVELSSGQC